MDSLNYGLIAEKLGISLKSVAHNTAAVIIDSEVFRESIQKWVESFNRIIEYLIL